MKKILVSDACVACGFCTAQSELIKELPNGKAQPAGTGLISDNQYADVCELIKNCLVGAISIEDEEITNTGGVEGTLELKKLIEDKLKAYKIKVPNRQEYEFKQEEYEVPLSVNTLESKYIYSDEDSAKSAGLSVFERNIYSQRKAAVQAVIVNYKNRKTRKFAYYIKEQGNYYHEINEEISRILSEISVVAIDITKGKIVLPDDFVAFEAGPDYGYEGDAYCYALRNMERMEHLDLENKFRAPSEYDIYINTDENYNGKACYDLNEVLAEIKDDVGHHLYMNIDCVDEWMEFALSTYRKLVEKKIGEKVAIVKAALKACTQNQESSETKYLLLKQDLLDFVNKIHKYEIKEQIAYKDIDTDYNSSHRFESRSKSEDAASNRLTRLYSECESYLSPRHLPNISEDLSKKYQKNIEDILNNVKNEIQAIYDKHEIAYPSIDMSICVEREVILFNPASLNDITSRINFEVKTFIDNKIIGHSGKIKLHEYFNYRDAEIFISETTKWKKGFFGESEYTLYNYRLDFRPIITGYDKACRACCEATYKEGYLQSYLKKIVDILSSAISDQIISKINTSPSAAQ